MSPSTARTDIPKTPTGRSRNVAKRLVGLPCWPQAINMLERGVSYRDVAKYIHGQGYCEDLDVSSAARAIARWANVYMKDRKEHPIPPEIIESIWEGAVSAVNEIDTLNRLIGIQMERLDGLIKKEREGEKYNSAIVTEASKTADMLVKLGRLKSMLGVESSKDDSENDDEEDGGGDDEEVREANLFLKKLIRDGVAISDSGEKVEVAGGSHAAKSIVRAGLVQGASDRRAHNTGE